MCADVALDGRRQMSEGAHGARELAHGHDLPRARDPRHVPIELGVPQRQLQAQRHGLGVHAVRAPDHRRAAVLLRTRANGRHQVRQALQHQVAGFAHLQRLRGVDDVGRRHAEVHPPGGRPDVLGHGRRERDDVVLRDGLDGFDAGDVERALGADVLGRLDRHDACAGHRLGGGGLHLQPRLVAALVAPDATHLGIGVARNHLDELRRLLAPPGSLPPPLTRGDPRPRG